jgi:hypothetical protein
MDISSVHLDIVRDLRELIDALDRRVPRRHREGEASIARDAAALRARAVTRIAELGGDPPMTGESQPAAADPGWNRDETLAVP